MTDAVVDLTDFNIFDPAVQQCPHLYYRAMQERDEPVFRESRTGFYLVTKHELVTPILRDTKTFSNNFGTAGMPPAGDVVERLREVYAAGWPRVSTMLTIDPPHHTRFRGSVAGYFTPKRLAPLRAPIEAVVHRLIDSMLARGEAFDFVPAFAIPVPIEAIALVLNVEPERMDDFKRWSDDNIADIGTILTDDQRVHHAKGIVEMQHYFAAKLESRRAEPQGDLMTELVQAEIDTDDGDGSKRLLSMPEMLSILAQLLVAGNETTTKSLTEGVRLLAENPDQWAKLKSDPRGKAAAVTEEVLRLSTPTQGMFRVATEDTEIAGTPIAKGSRLVVMYTAANRDPDIWGDDPDRFDIDRPNHKDHLAFGKGIHFCLGAPLSRLEMQVAFELLATRLDSIELAPDNGFTYFPSFMLRGLTRLSVNVTPAQ